MKTRLYKFNAESVGDDYFDYGSSDEDDLEHNRKYLKALAAKSGVKLTKIVREYTSYRAYYRGEYTKLKRFYNKWYFGGEYTFEEVVEKVY